MTVVLDSGLRRNDDADQPYDWKRKGRPLPEGVDGPDD